MKELEIRSGVSLDSLELEALFPQSSILLSFFIRVFVVVMTLPLGGSVKFIPRVLLAVGLTLGLAPSLSHTGTNISPSWAAQIVTEVTLGILVTLPIRLFVEGAHTLGELVDTARGQTIGAIQDPLNGPGGSDLAAIFKLAALTSTLYFGGMHLLVEAIVQSVSGFPPGPATNLFDVFEHGVPIKLLLAPLSATCSLAVLWILPFVAVDLFAALAHRVCQVLTFSQFSMLLKVIATCALVALLFLDSFAAPGSWLRPADPRTVIRALLS